MAAPVHASYVDTQCLDDDEIVLYLFSFYEH